MIHVKGGGLRDEIRKSVEELILRRQKKGTIAFEQVQKLAGRHKLSAEEQDEIGRVLQEKGIQVVRKSPTREWVESIVIAFILAMFIREFFFQAFRIPSGSMRRTLIEGDRLLVNKLHYGPRLRFTHKRLPGFSKPQRGDVIVFIYPDDPKRDFIKRLVGLGGETVEIREGKIYINGKVLDQAPFRNIYYYNNDGEYGKEGQKIVVPPDHFFVLGDNSASSSDSRYWGFVPEENVVGKAALIYWPITRIRFIH